MRGYKKITLLVCLLFLLTGCHLHSSNDLTGWEGYYGWSDSVPGSTAGSTPLWEYVAIFIYKENGTYYANYVANGYQLGIIAKAQVVGNEEKITLVFKEYKENSYQQPFEVGDELFSLTKKQDGIITTWITDSPNFVGNDSGIEGIYFATDNDGSIKEYFNKNYIYIEPIAKSPWDKTV